MRWRERSCLALVAIVPLWSYPLSWLPFSVAQYRFAIVLPLAPIALVVLLMALALRCLSGPVSAAWPQKLAGPLLALAASALVSVRFSRHPEFSLDALPAALGNLAIFLLAADVRTPDLAAAGACWLSASVLVAITGILRGGTGPEFVSVIGNRNFVAAYLAASLCVGAGLWGALVAGRREAGNRSPRGLCSMALGLAACLLLAALGMCRSRGAWLALALVAVIGFLAVGPGKPAWRWIGILCIGAIVAAAGWRYARRQWQTDVRPEIWRGTLEMIGDRPLSGHGLGVFWIDYVRFRPPEYFLRPKAANLTDHAHSELLEIAAEQGLAGAAATLWLWITVLVLAVRAWRTEPDRRTAAARLGLIGAVLVFLFHGLVDVDLRHLPNQTLFWLAMGLIVSGGTPLCEGRLMRSGVARAVLGAAGLAAAAAMGWMFVLKPLAADAWERQARVADSRGDQATAVLAADQALEIDPLRVETRSFLAGALAQSGSEQQRRVAIEQCLLVEQLAPDYADITYNLGQLYLAVRQPQEALPWLQRAVRLNPYNADKRVSLGMALADLGRPAESREQWEAALGLRPGDQRIRDLLSAGPPSGRP